MQDVQQVWQNTLDVVRGELNTPTFKTWFEQTAPLGIVDHEMVVSVQNDFARDWLETRYSSLLASALTQVTGSPMAVRFSVPGDLVATVESAVIDAPMDAPPPFEEAPSAAGRPEESDLDSQSTFDSFVVGPSNQFSYHVALAVAETPGTAYNPLFIYGGAGLGKTHLLKAIGSYVRSSYPYMKVTYVTSEQFTNDFIKSIGDKSRTAGFRRTYRENDVLLVDDIQFIAGKEGTQTEFFHTFNTLREAGKQIVMTSDRPPVEIGNIEERLRTRFGGGLIADIQPPDLETRIAILRRKAQAEGHSVPDDVLTLIADRFSSNIRELWGALLRVVAFSSVTRHVIDLELAQGVLKDIFPERSIKPISISLIKDEVCRFYGISKNELVGNKRSQSIAYPRQIGMYLSRELTDHSLPKIGSEFGGRDHTTVIYAERKIQRLMTEQRDVYNQIQTLTNLIRQRN
ncbi:MAG: chromosomal replication initiator protein DnaA [Actinobacteria bacterium]|nr:chromosomal replication initiator protein DnaA [Actinomycetota bacterium]